MQTAFIKGNQNSIGDMKMKRTNDLSTNSLKICLEYSQCADLLTDVIIRHYPEAKKDEKLMSGLKQRCLAIIWESERL
jgi:hypothetical protein